MFDGEFPRHFHFVNQSLPQLLSRTNLLLYSSTSVCFDALARGVPILSVVPEMAIDLDDLRWFPWFRRAANSPQALRNETETILSMSVEETVRWVAQARQIVASVLAPVTSECVEAFLE